MSNDGELLKRFDKWADSYALDFEPLTRNSVRADCFAAYKAADAEARAEIEALKQQVSKYQDLCACAYQAAGAYDLPVRFLDALSDAANGSIESRVKNDALLPVEAVEVSDERG